jgi:hypothetical protein
MWCRAVTPLLDGTTIARQHANNLTHTHVWTCGKKPTLDSICTSSVMFPITTDAPGLPDDDDFLPFFFMARKLEGLATVIKGDATIIISHTLVTL